MNDSGRRPVGGGATKPSFVFAWDPERPPRDLEGAVYAIGNFDGIHIGHQSVLGRTLALARACGAPSAILTFEPHPADYFAGRPVVFRLTPPQVKRRVFEELGFSGAVVMTFDASLAMLSAEEFVVNVLVRRLSVSAVVVGWDFHFGKGRSGNPSFLIEAGARYGFGVEVVSKVQGGEGEAAQVVSSTLVRRALEQGDVEGAARALDRFYSVEGTIIGGQRLGRTLGVPTANIALEPTNRLAHGVYAVWVRIDDRRHPGVASFGVRPTIEIGAPMLEVHILDFAGDLYGRTIGVEFVRRIRDELKFASLGALVAEMQRDKQIARAMLAQMA